LNPPTLTEKVPSKREENETKQHERTFTHPKMRNQTSNLRKIPGNSEKNKTKQNLKKKKGLLLLLLSKLQQR